MNFERFFLYIFHWMNGHSHDFMKDDMTCSDFFFFFFVFLYDDVCI
jgi:hypothetical protein